MPPMRETPITATKLTVDALQHHQAFGAGRPFRDEYDYEILDCVSEANADCGVGSSHSLSLPDSPFEDIPRFGCPGDTSRFVCRGTWDGRVVPHHSDEDDDIIAGVEPHTEHDPLKGNRVAVARLALADFDKAFACRQTFSVEPAMQQRNTTEVFAFIENRDAQIDVEKTDVSFIYKPAIITKGQGLAGMVAVTVVLGGVVVFALLAADMGRSAIVACGVSLFLAMLAIALTMKR